jgi:hypothetical protein
MMNQLAVRPWKILREKKKESRFFLFLMVTDYGILACEPQTTRIFSLGLMVTDYVILPCEPEITRILMTTWT